MYHWVISDIHYLYFFFLNMSLNFHLSIHLDQSELGECFRAGQQTPSQVRLTMQLPTM